MANLPVAVLGCTLTVSNASGQAIMTPLVSLPSTTTMAESIFVIVEIKMLRLPLVLMGLTCKVLLLLET